MTHSILYIHDGFLNPGDCFSYSGTRHYVSRIGVVYEHSVVIESTSSIPSLIHVSGPDHLVLAGAPWIWDRCTFSEKYAGMTALLRMARDVHKVAIGIGSCFLPKDVDYALTTFVQNEKAALHEFWSQFDEIVVRDILAWHILDAIGIESTLAPCPSVAVGEWFGKPAMAGGELLLAEDIRRNFVYSYLPQECLEYFGSRIAAMRALGCKEMMWCCTSRAGLHARSLRSMCTELAGTGADRFFTARVHASLVASGMGLQGELMVVDSRALSAELLGVRLVGPQAEMLLRASDRLKADGPPMQVIGVAIANAVRAVADGGVERYIRSDAVPVAEITGTTRFFRNRLQHQTLLRHLKGPRVLVVGASRGCEAYSLAIESALAGKPLQIDAIDIDAANVAFARAGVFPKADAVDFDGTNLLTDDVAPYFDARDRSLVVRRESLRRIVHFSCSDLFTVSGAYDAIICNNVLIHFADRHAKAAIDYLIGCLTPEGILAIGGISPDVLSEAVGRAGSLDPIVDDLEAIWDSWKGDRLSWQTDPDAYVAMPPVDRDVAGWEVRFSTLFQKRRGLQQ